MSFGIPVRNGLAIGLSPSTTLSSGRGTRPSLILNFLTTTSLDSRITFSRGSQAMVTDATGKLTYAPNNLLTNSESFEASSWTKTRSSITANATTSPDGTVDADKLVEDTTAASTHFTTQTATVASGATVTCSVYAKAAERTRVVVQENSSGATVTVNLANGSIISGSGTVQDAGNGWYRISVTSTVPATTAIMGIYLRDATSSSYTGNGTSGIYIWGAQLEAVTYQTTPGTYNATTSAAYYGPRFDYDPVTLAAKGLLIEEQRTNLLLRSEEFDNAAWTKTDTTVTANAIASPDGTTTADLLTEGSAGTAQVGATVNVSSGATVAASVYVKRGNTDWVRMTVVNGANFYRAWFNLATGAVGTAAAGGTGVLTSAGVTNAGNGWYRLALVGSIPATTAYSVFINTTSADNSPTRVSGGTYYAWGAQLEAGSFATSYIPTAASTATRSADVATMTGANFSSWYNQTAGTFVVGADAYVPIVTSTFRSLDASDGTTSNRIGAFVYSGKWGSTATVAGVFQYDLQQSSSYTANVPAKTAFAYKANDFAVSVNGSAALTDTAGAVPAVDRLSIACSNGVNQLNGHIRTLTYYPSRLPNATLQSLTA